MNKKIKLLLLFLIASISFSACASNKPNAELTLVKQEQLVLGTFGQISAYSSSEAEGNAAISKAYERITEIENLMSTSIEESDVYHINQNAGVQPVQINPSTLEVLQKGLEYFPVSKETFNIGLGSLIDLWGIGKDWQKIPTQQEILTAMNHIDLAELQVSEKDRTAFIKDSDMLLDLGGIAKGYAVDEAIDILRKNGIKSGLVNLGGDIYALGTKTDGTPWRVGVNNPHVGQDNSIIRITVSDKSVVTSGDYERFFVENDIRYHHIIDPKTGYPADSGLVSVTIVSDKSMDGDVLSTSVFILGLEEGLNLIESLPGVEAILISKDNLVYASSGIKGNMEILDDNFKMGN